MEKKSIKAYQEFSEKRFTKRVIFNNGNSTAFVLNFLPGQMLPAHKHPDAEVYLFVVSGKGTMIIDGRELEVTETDLIHTSGDEELSFFNTSNDGVSLYVVLNKLSK
ncbi:cupin domain-containing protein [Neobacillus fumarioli]|uniref:cupin domain-containing protein n=1 Tax=Neobacillus fumarioli TaxID=105229 RepID=UPI00082DF97C|nr:cupin domain-containing protein [Neobacillus fumarioli]